MATQFRCFDDPEGILTKPFCVSALSKDLKGKMPLRSSKKQECKEPKCITLRTQHEMKATIVGTNCDSGLAKSFNGGLEFGNLSTAFDTDGMHRGFHAADFVWFGINGLKVEGRMSGVTNEGSHRLPIKACQKCSDLGIMEGRLCGQVTATQDPALKGCQVIAAYRIKFDPSVKGGSGAVIGTIEGVIICPCG
jgi:hypothetical protein